MPAARSLEDCLEADGGLSRLTGHAARLLRLRQLFESAVPRPLARGARVANLKFGKLVVHADNGAVAAKLRQIIPTLIDAFRKNSAEVTGIEVKVQPRLDVKPKKLDETRSPLGDHAKQGLTSLAESLPADSALRGALKHFVKHT
ncbi:MAG: DUF721 domain-containing protein [Rhodocyclales bacterium]|nr:DUF721 domain-containing protein [Rhodocyclales bacterium]